MSNITMVFVSKQQMVNVPRKYEIEKKNRVYVGQVIKLYHNAEK